MTGYRVSHNLVLVQPRDFKKVFGTSLPPSAIDLRLSTLVDTSGTKTKGVLMRHPLLPWTDV